jgi:hypothetical protein
MEGASEPLDPTGGTGAAIPGCIAHDGPSFDSHKRLSANYILVSAALADRFSLCAVPGKEYILTGRYTCRSNIALQAWHRQTVVGR